MPFGPAISTWLPRLTVISLSVVTGLPSLIAVMESIFKICPLKKAGNSCTGIVNSRMVLSSLRTSTLDSSASSAVSRMRLATARSFPPL